MTKRLCSGLGSFNSCNKRSQCANYVHWLDDPRSEFNVCTITGQPFNHFVPRDISMVAAAVQSQHGQGSLF